MHAAGWNVITNTTATNVPSGLGDPPLNSSAIILGSQLDKGAYPLPGDFFHKEGESWTIKGNTIYSVHVGIVVSWLIINPWGLKEDKTAKRQHIQTWDVVEGGQSPNGFWTRFHPNKDVIKVAPVKVSVVYNHWGFADDQSRPIQKWNNLENLSRDRLMFLSP